MKLNKVFKVRISALITVGAVIIALAIFTLGTVASIAQEQVGTGPELQANRVELTLVPDAVNLGDQFQVLAQVRPQSGPLPITYTVGNPGLGSISGVGGYSFSGNLTARVTEQPIVTVTAIQGTNVFTDSKLLTVVGPQGVSITAPPEVQIGESVTITAQMLGWSGHNNKTDFFGKKFDILQLE